MFFDKLPPRYDFIQWTGTNTEEVRGFLANYYTQMLAFELVPEPGVNQPARLIVRPVAAPVDDLHHVEVMIHGWVGVDIWDASHFTSVISLEGTEGEPAPTGYTPTPT